MPDKDINAHSAVKQFNKLGGCNTGFGYDEALCPVCRCLPHTGDCTYKLAMIGSDEMASIIRKAFDEVVSSLGFLNMFESRQDMLDIDTISMLDAVAIPLSEDSQYLYDITISGITTNAPKHKAFIMMELYNKLGFRVRVTMKEEL